MTATTKAAGVYEALMARVATISTGSPALPIAFPEAASTFSPPASGKYLEVRYFPNTPLFGALASGVVDQGLVLVTIVWPKNDGLVRPLEIAGAVVAHFPIGLKLISGAFRVKVSAQTYVAAPLHDADRLRIPVTVSWAA